MHSTEKVGTDDNIANEEVPFCGPILVIARTYGHKTYFGDVTPGVVTTSFRSVTNFFVSFYFCEYTHYGGVSNMISHGHVHIRCPFMLHL